MKKYTRKSKFILIKLHAKYIFLTYMFFLFGYIYFPWRTLLGRTNDLVYYVDTLAVDPDSFLFQFWGRSALPSLLAVRQVVFQGFVFSPRRWFSRPDGPYFLTEFFGSKEEEVCCWSWTGWPVLPSRMLRHQRGEEDCCWSFRLVLSKCW